MRVETTYKHAYAAGTRRGCPCCLPVFKWRRVEERQKERRMANADARREAYAMGPDIDIMGPDNNERNSK